MIVQHNFCFKKQRGTSQALKEAALRVLSEPRPWHSPRSECPAPAHSIGAMELGNWDLGKPLCVSRKRYFWMRLLWICWKKESTTIKERCRTVGPSLSPTHNPGHGPFRKNQHQICMFSFPGAQGKWRPEASQGQSATNHLDSNSWLKHLKIRPAGQHVNRLGPPVERLE